MELLLVFMAGVVTGIVKDRVYGAVAQDMTGMQAAQHVLRGIFAEPIMVYEAVRPAPVKVMKLVGADGNSVGYLHRVED